jgi:hypothetical protein
MKAPAPPIPPYHEMADILLGLYDKDRGGNAMPAYQPANAMRPYEPSANAMVSGPFASKTDINKFLYRELEAFERVLIPNALRRTAWKQTAGSIYERWCIDARGQWILRDAEKDSPFAWDADHIIPREQGGTDHPTNLRALNCFSNRSEGDRRP